MGSTASSSFPRATRLLPWTAVLRAAAAATLLGAAAIHAGVADEHFGVWIAEGVFFIVLGQVEALLALAVAARPSRRVYAAGLAVSLATVALWTVSRTVGVPVGPGAWKPEAVGRADVMACLLELTTAAVLAPLISPRPAPAALSGAALLVFAAAAGATAFALLPRAAADGGHDHGAADQPVRVPPAGPTGEFSLADARRARRCAARARDAPAARPRVRVTIVASGSCFDRSTLTLAADRPVVVRVVNRERSHSPLRAHAFSIYAFSTIAARRHPVLLGDPVAAGKTGDERFEAPAPGSYFFQCDIHRFMRGLVVFR